MNRVGWGATLIALVLHAVPAQGSEEAHEAFRQGREAADRGEYAEACARFEASLEMVETAGTVLNLADCNEHLEEYLVAQGQWQKGLELMPPDDPRRSFVQGRLDRIQKLIPRIKVTVSGDAAGAQLLIDGRPRRLGEALAVEPGRHHVEVRRAGKALAIRHLELQRGQRKHLEFAADGSDDGGASSPWMTAGWALVGTGAGGVVVAAITGLAFLAEEATVEEECDWRRACSRSGLEAAESAEALGAMSTASLIIGTATMASGVGILIFGPDAAASGDDVSIHVAPTPMGFQLTGRF